MPHNGIIFVVYALQKHANFIGEVTRVHKATTVTNIPENIHAHPKEG